MARCILFIDHYVSTLLEQAGHHKWHMDFSEGEGGNIEQWGSYWPHGAGLEYGVSSLKRVNMILVKVSRSRNKIVEP